MHKLPDKMRRGWKRHADAFNDLREYAGKTHPIPAHGHRETVNGTMPPPLLAEILPQFTPRLLTGASPVLNITPGYVFGAWHDDATASSSIVTAGGADLPEIQQAVIEPTIAGISLTANPAPGLTIGYPGNTYFYLKLIWKPLRAAVQGYTIAAIHNFRLDISRVTGVDVDLNEADRHTHTIGISPAGDPVTVVDAGSPPGMSASIHAIQYSLISAAFIAQFDQAPKLETELITYIPAGYISLDADGEVTAGVVFDDDDGLRWFLQGAVTAHRPPHYVTGVTAGQDRAEPVLPTQAEGYVMPGQGTDA